MFPTDIRHIADTELSAHLKGLIEGGEPESVYLDYKGALDISKESGRKELAKDISSFANEQGGKVIYGVPEMRGGDLPRPKPLAECGMDIPAGLPGQVESILLSAVQPVLHGLTIRVVEIQDIHPKKLLLVYQPESYWKPHMVEGYGDRRYYRRGNFRVVQMNQREVEAAYQVREAARRHAQDFFATGSLGPTTHGVQIRAVACPVLPGRFKNHMLQPGFADWLEDNKPMGPKYPRKGEWLPFLDGWRFLALPEGSISGKQYEIRVFHNGAVCLNLDPDAQCLKSGFLLLDGVKQDLGSLFISYTATVFQGLVISGPVIMQMSILRAKGLEAAVNLDDLCCVIERREQLAQGKRVQVGRKFLGKDPDGRSPFLDREAIVFEEESSTDEILNEADNILGRVMTRISTAFGLWDEQED